MTPRLTELAHAAVRAVLRPGDTAVDATAGNGRDTRFLAELVTRAGRVFGFDVQPEALARAAGAVRGLGQVTLLARDHAELADALPPEARGRVRAVMFNLGYLPGGDKAVTTRPDSTARALAAAAEVLAPGGVLTVLAYPAHPGGAEEAAAVADLLAGLPAHAFAVRETRGTADNPASPRLFVALKR
jgi:predicted methyltransferase